ncbi:hypothetical protein StoSoilB5_21720 [Arthrobacter sp. StoSoilB5]|nr:hypothetical protein StoSoilB5_21720 [Arthrobacter sp. StoSoilB5]
MRRQPDKAAHSFFTIECKITDHPIGVKSDKIRTKVLSWQHVKKERHSLGRARRNRGVGLWLHV